MATNFTRGGPDPFARGTPIDEAAVTRREMMAIAVKNNIMNTVRPPRRNPMMDQARNRVMKKRKPKAQDPGLKSMFQKLFGNVKRVTIEMK